MLLCDFYFINMFFSAACWKAWECLELHGVERNPVEFKCIQQHYICVFGKRMTSTSSSDVQSALWYYCHSYESASVVSEIVVSRGLTTISSAAGSSRRGGRRRRSRTRCAQWRCIFINSRHANTWMRQHIQGRRSIIISQGLYWRLLLKQCAFVHCRVTVFH